MRDSFYDMVKGLAIIFVVVGHVIQSFTPDYETNSLFLFIYSFHMPLFMIISGKFFLSSISRISLIDFVKKKFFHLYLPSLIWGGGACFLVGGVKLLQHKSFDLLYAVDLFFTGMWFLTVLFILSVVGGIIEKAITKFKLLIWCSIFILCNVLPNFWMRNEIIYLLPFFVGSIFLSKKDWSKISTGYGIVALLIFVYFLYFFTFDDSMYRMQDDFMSLQYHKSAFLRLITGTTGSFMVLWIARYLKHYKRVENQLKYVGCLTLPIYVLHQKFMLWNNYSEIIVDKYVFVFVIAILILYSSCLLYKVLSKNYIISLLLFGEYEKGNDK